MDKIRRDGYAQKGIFSLQNTPFAEKTQFPGSIPYFSVVFRVGKWRFLPL